MEHEEELVAVGDVTQLLVVALLDVFVHLCISNLSNALHSWRDMLVVQESDSRHKPAKLVEPSLLLHTIYVDGILRFDGPVRHSRELIVSLYTWNATPSLFTIALPPLAKPVPSLLISTSPGFGAFSFSFFFLLSLPFSLASGALVKSASQT